MKTLLIVTYHPDEWREHAHIISWLRSIGYEVSMTNIIEWVDKTNEILHSIVTDVDIVILYHTETGNPDTDTICKEVAERCIEMERPIFGIYTQTQIPNDIGSNPIQWREWNTETMAFFMRVISECEENSRKNYQTSYR